MQWMVGLRGFVGRNRIQMFSIQRAADGAASVAARLLRCLPATAAHSTNAANSSTISGIEINNGVLSTFPQRFILGSLLLKVATIVALSMAIALGVSPKAAFAIELEAVTQNTVYLGGTGADDNNDGSDPSKSVATFERAKELLAEDGTIALRSPLRPTGNTTYSLEGKGEAKVIHADTNIGAYGPLVIVDSGVQVTFEHIVLDGEGTDDNYADAAILADGPDTTITLGEGAVIQNYYSSGGEMGSAMKCRDGVTVIMEEGSALKNNHTSGASYGTIYLANKSHLEMRGGEISGNVANRGGAVALLASSMNMSGGSLTGNSTYAVQNESGGDSYGGAIYMSNYEEISGTPGSENDVKAGPSSFIMTGGVIAENRAGNYGGAICTLPDVRDGATGDISITIDQQAVIRDNYSDNGGGAIAAWELNGIATHLLISGGEITGNEARNNGGGLFVYGTDSDELVSMTGAPYPATRLRMAAASFSTQIRMPRCPLRAARCQITLR